MKLTINRPVQVEIVAIKCELPVRYDEEDIPNAFPLRQGDMWIGTVDIETGIIRNWPLGQSGAMHMKVCDEGVYSLLGANDEVVARTEGYVPSCIPGLYGDYVEFGIDETGKVARWFQFCTKRHIYESFCGEDELG